MENYKEYELGSNVTATRTFGRETITGEFGGFHLLDKSNPKSIVGVVHTPNGSYDVEPNSIESVISKDEKIRKSIIDLVEKQMPKSENKKWMIAWLEKQGKHISAWSEKDEETLNSILSDLRQGVIPDDEDIQWLKSLKERYTWKPSDEQIESLKEAVDKHWEPDGLDPLYTLYQDLKKLKGE